MASTPVQLGFLTVFQDGPGWLGAYFVTNAWGRPLDFRLSSSVQPNKIQHILYADTLLPHLCSDIIGKAPSTNRAWPLILSLPLASTPSIYVASSTFRLSGSVPSTRPGQPTRSSSR